MLNNNSIQNGRQLSSVFYGFKLWPKSTVLVKKSMLTLIKKVLLTLLNNVNKVEVVMKNNSTIIQYYFAAFLIPFLLLGIVFALWGVYPFGERSILMADQYTQYIQFYSHFYDTLKGNGSLLYSWEAGMGLNFWGTFAYYLSSPVSWLVFFFERDNLPEALILITLVKIGLSGLTMYIYLTKLLTLDKISKLLFSTSFALCSFSIGYFFNIMWLDGVFLLPLVLLGTESIFLKKYLLFIGSLTLLFISNFYIAFIVGLFTFLYFIIKSFLLNQTAKQFLKKLMAFFVCTLLAGGLSAFLTLPTYFVLKSNSYQSFKWEGITQTNFGFFEFFTKLFNSSSELFILPNVFAGTLVLLLAPLFFISRGIGNREKFLLGLLICILFISLQINDLNTLWHGLSKPTGYAHRFAFVFSFLLVYLAIRAYCVIQIEDIPNLFKCCFGFLMIVILLNELEPELMSMRKTLFNLFLILALCFLLYGKIASTSNRNVFLIMLLLLTCIDLSVNIYNHLKTLNSYSGYSILRSQFNVSNPNFENLVTDLNEDDKEFFRLNSTIRITPNDSLRYNYRGMTNFNTLSNGTLHEFMNKLGYSTTIGARTLTQNQGILSSDSLFAFKYLITDQPIEKHGYKEVACTGNACLYENINKLPIGFMIDKWQVEFNDKVDNPFINQNQFLGTDDGEGMNYFEQVDETSVKYQNLRVEEVDDVIFINKIDENLVGSIEFTFNIDGDKQFYTLLSAGKGFPGFGETKLYVNGSSLGIYPYYHRDRVLELGSFSNEKVTIKIEFLVPKTKLTQRLFYTLDIPNYEARLEQLREQSLEVSRWGDTYVLGSVRVKEPNTLFLSIPYDEGWTATVDDESIPIKQIGGFIGFPLDEGNHLIELKFRPKGFILGCIISTITFILVLSLGYVHRSRVRNNIRDSS